MNIDKEIYEEYMEEYMDDYKQLIEEQYICNILTDTDKKIKEHKKILRNFEIEKEIIEFNYKGKYKKFLLDYQNENLENFKKYIKETEKIFWKFQRLLSYM